MHTAVVDVGYGDAGKGALVDRLCAQGDVSLVVRWNGGCQAQHNVIQDDGRHHTFSQFGSGSFHGVPTYLADPVMVEPLSMMIEAEALSNLINADAMRLMHVSPECLITTPYHWLVNRWQEDARGDSRHGSTGRGIGMTQQYALYSPHLALRVRDVLQNERETRRKLRALEDWALMETNDEIRSDLPDISRLMACYAEWVRKIKCMTASQIDRSKRIVFEGAQGVLLDEHFGWHPHTTWSTVTPGWVREFTDGDVDVIGVTRAYTTRHGAGPFVAEDESLNLPESHNKREHFQGSWRVGHFDLPAIQYGARAAQVDSIYVTHLDTAAAEPALRVCAGYSHQGDFFRPLPLISDDFDRREDQTRRLIESVGIFTSRPHECWAQSISELLSLPLAGSGLGPRTGQSTGALSTL